MSIAGQNRGSMLKWFGYVKIILNSVIGIRTHKDKVVKLI